MTDETAPVSLTDEDRRLLAALLDELAGQTQDGRPTPQPHRVQESSHDGDAARSTTLASPSR
jgi:hypothetical protein